MGPRRDREWLEDDALEEDCGWDVEIADIEEVDIEEINSKIKKLYK